MWVLIAVVAFILGAICGAGGLIAWMASDSCGEIDAHEAELRLWEEKYRRTLKGRYTP